MRKNKVLFSVLLLACILLVGCGGSGEKSQSERNAARNWKMNPDATTIAIPAEAANAYNEAIETYTGKSLTPIALLATKTEAPKEYIFLCKEDTSDKEVTYKIVSVSQGENGSELYRNNKFEYEKYFEKEIKGTQDPTTGIAANAENGYADLENKIYMGFVNATAKDTDAVYTPLALLATSDATDEYAFLCLEQTVGEDQSNSIKVLILEIKSETDSKITQKTYVNLEELL